jgi:uncharacterized protein YqjF (DUF2071 family)
VAPIKLKAAWRKLIMANYSIDPDLLLPLVPKGTQLDFLDNHCYISLVGFRFDHSSLNGIPIPFHQSFEEVNLRFYVLRKEGEEFKRGVVFIREFVPKVAVTYVANGVFQEHYEMVRMQHDWNLHEKEQTIKYSWKKNKWHSLEIKSGTQALLPGNTEEFFSEHYWGYTQIDGHAREYFVDHQPWKVYSTLSFAIAVDFETCYGKAFGFLNDAKPASVFLAEGSEISLQKTQDW